MLPDFPIAAAGIMFDCYGPVAGSHEHEIQNLSPGSSVAVREWMDVLEHRVESGSFEDRVVFGTVHRVHERFHVLVDFKWVAVFTRVAVILAW